MDIPVRVLLVEDSPDDVLLILNELRRGGYNPTWQRVDTADAMQEALNNKPWDIVLSDYSMPGFNGLNALALLRKSGGDLPFILVSGAVGEELAVLAMRAGAHDYVMKGNLSRLVPAVERELEEAKVRKERKRAEEELKLQAELLDAATDSITLREFSDNVAGKPVYANKAAYESRGYTKEEFMKMDIQDYTLTEGSISLEKRFELLKEQGEATYEVVQRRKDGSPITMEIHARILTLNDKKYVLSVSRDITQRKKRQEELRLRAEIIDSVTDAIYLREMNGRIVYVNNAMSKVYGYSKNELTGMTTRDLVSPKLQHQFGMRVNEAKGKEGLVIESEHLRKDGTSFPNEVHFRVLEYDGKEHVLGVVLDRTVEKQTQKRLQEAEARYRTLFEQSPDGILLIDPETAGIIELNDTAWKQLGYSREEMSRMRIFDLEAIENPEETRQRIAGILERGQDYFITKHRAKDGNIRDMAVSVKTIEISGHKLMFGIFRDITEQIRNEQELKASEERFRTLVENAPVGIGLSTFDGRILFRNKALFEISGFTNEELIDTPVSSRYADPKDWERLVQLAKKGPVRDFEVRMKHKNGSIYWASYTAIPQKTESGDGYLSISQDITRRKLTEEALRDSEERFRSLVENAPVGIGISALDGRSIYRNKTAATLYGFDSPQELIARTTASNYDDPRDRERFVALVKQGIVRDLETKLKRKDGTTFWGSITAIPYKTPLGDGFISVLQDITEKKQARQALEDSEEKFRTLFEYAPVGIAISSVDGQSVERNSTLVEMLGYDSKEEMAKTLATDRYVDPTDREKFLEILRHGPVRDFEVRFKRKDGTPFWVSMSSMSRQGKPSDKIIIVTIDITERKQAEELFQTLAESTPAGIFIIQDGKFQYANRQFLAYTGYAPDEIMDKDFTGIVAASDRDTIKTQISSTTKDGLVYLKPREIHLVDKTGWVKSVILMVVPITYRQKDAIIGSCLDITDYKNLEKQVVEYKELNELKINLLSVVSHELRTPLATIKGYNSLLQQYYDKLPDAEKKEHLATIDRATDRMGDLVEGLLEMSRLDAGLLVLNKTRTSLTKLLQDTVGEANVRIPTHDVSLAIDKRLPGVNIDTRRMRQVVDNLIDNARKYSKQGTKIEIGAKRRGQEIVVSVTDHGNGIPPEEMPRIFDRMYRIEKRLTPQSGGLGLGLSLCKGLVEAHGGRIWAESTLGEGSTFYFSLPLDTEKSKA